MIRFKGSKYPFIHLLTLTFVLTMFLPASIAFSGNEGSKITVAGALQEKVELLREKNKLQARDMREKNNYKINFLRSTSRIHQKRERITNQVEAYGQRSRNSAEMKNIRSQNQLEAEILIEKNRSIAKIIIAKGGIKIEKALLELNKSEARLAKKHLENEKLSELIMSRAESREELKRAKLEAKKLRELDKAKEKEISLIHLEEIRSEILRNRLEVRVQRESHDY